MESVGWDRSNPWLGIGAISGFLTVLFGAFGAHLLAQHLDLKSLSHFETAVKYQMFHSIALLILGTCRPESRGRAFVGAGFTLGILLFCGSLYALALTRIKMFGAVTPFGGLLFLGSWAVLAYLAFCGKTLQK